MISLEYLLNQLDNTLIQVDISEVNIYISKF